MPRFKRIGQNDATKCILGNCWVCGKGGNTIALCKHKKGQSSNNQANVVENDKVITITSKVNMTSNIKGCGFKHQRLVDSCG